MYRYLLWHIPSLQCPRNDIHHSSRKNEKIIGQHNYFYTVSYQKPEEKRSSRMHALDVHAEKLTLDDHNSSFIVI